MDRTTRIDWTDHSVQLDHPSRPAHVMGIPTHITTTSGHNYFLCVLSTPCFSAICVQARKTPLRRAAQASRTIYLIRKPAASLLRETTTIVPFHCAAQSIYFKGEIRPTGWRTRSNRIHRTCQKRVQTSGRELE